MQLIARQPEGTTRTARFGWDFVVLHRGWYFKLTHERFYFRYRSWDKLIWEWYNATDG